MKKRIAAFVLSFIMIIGTTIPASAHQDDSVILVPVEDFDPGMPAYDVPDYTALPIRQTPVAAEETQSASRASTLVSVKQIIVYPIVMCLETEQLYRIADVKRSVLLGDGYQTYGLHLTSEDLNQIVAETNDVLVNHSEYSKYTWAICGWWETAVVNFTAERPVRVEVRGSQSRPVLATEYTVYNLTAASTTKTFNYQFYIPERPNEYYAIGIDGAFYFKYTSGSQEGSYLFNASVSFNY